MAVTAVSSRVSFGRIECSRFDFPGEFYELCVPLRNLSREITELLLGHDALPDLLPQLREAELHLLDFCCLPLTRLACLLMVTELRDGRGDCLLFRCPLRVLCHEPGQFLFVHGLLPEFLGKGADLVECRFQGIDEGLFPAELLLPFAIGDGLVGEFPEFCLELGIEAPEMLAKFLPAERAGAICACGLDGLPVSEDLLPLFGVAHLLCGQRTGPLVDLREPETDSTIEPVLRNLRPCTEPGPDLRDEPGLLLRLAVQSLDQRPLFLDPGCKVGNLPRGKPEFCREPEMLGLLLPEPVQPLPDFRIGAGGLFDPVVLCLLVGDEGERGFEVLCLCGIGVPFALECLLLLEEPGIRGLLLGKEFQVRIETGSLCPVEFPGFGVLRDRCVEPCDRCLQCRKLIRALPSGHGCKFAFLPLEFPGLSIDLLF